MGSPSVTKESFGVQEFIRSVPERAQEMVPDEGCQPSIDHLVTLSFKNHFHNYGSKVYDSVFYGDCLTHEL